MRTYLGVEEVLYCVANLGLDDLGLKLERASSPDGHLEVGGLDRHQA